MFSGASTSGTASSGTGLKPSDNFGESAVQELIAMGFPREQVQTILLFRYFCV